jgi:hypothetical protein
MKKNVIILMVMLATIVVIPMVAMAQSGPVETPPNTGGANGDVDGTAPIDGGLSLLVAAGVGYGAKKLKEKRKHINPNK